MELAKTFENVHWLFDPLLNRGLTNLMDYFEDHGVDVDLRRAIKIGRTGVNTSVTLTVHDVKIRDGFTEYAKDVQFVLKRRERNGSAEARALADVSHDRRIVCDLLKSEECARFADGLLQMMQNRGMVAQVPRLPAAPSPAL